MLNDAAGFKRIFIAAGYTDLRRGIDGLAGIVQYQFERKRSNPCTLTFKRPLTTVFLFSDVFWQLW